MDSEEAISLFNPFRLVRWWDIIIIILIIVTQPQHCRPDVYDIWLKLISFFLFWKNSHKYRPCDVLAYAAGRPPIISPAVVSRQDYNVCHFVVPMCLVGSRAAVHPDLCGLTMWSFSVLLLCFFAPSKHIKVTILTNWNRFFLNKQQDFCFCYIYRCFDMFILKNK